MKQLELSEFDFIYLNFRGLLPGPEESKEEYLSRIQAQEINKNFLFSKKNLQILHDLYGYIPDWFQVCEPKGKIRFWEGAITEIQPDKHQATIYIKLFQKGANEQLCHELVHLGRMAYEEPVFEEFFAYATSSSKLRKYLGPVFRNRKEVYIFLGMIFFSSFSDIYWVLSSSLWSCYLFYWIKFLLGGYVFLGLTRLTYNWYVFRKCHQKLAKFFSSSQKAMQFMYRLRDKEIHKLSKEQLITLQSFDFFRDNSMRWQMLSKVFEF